MGDRLRRARTYGDKWLHYNANRTPWRRLAIHRELMARECFVRWPIEGNFLDALRSGAVDLGRHVLFEPHVWIDVLGGRLKIGDYSSFNIGVMISVSELVEIGSHCLFANGCFISDADHRFDDRERPVPWQGLAAKGPTRIGDNVWCGANVVVTGGVTVGDRCVIGANSVVTSDLPARTVCAGIPARPIHEIEYSDELLPPVDLRGGWR